VTGRIVLQSAGWLLLLPCWMRPVGVAVSNVTQAG
jgi:hypothetical protein